LRDRNQAIEFSFKKITANSFTGAVYVAGAKKTSCHIWLPGRKTFGVDIAYASNDSVATNSINDWMRVEDDGYRLGLKGGGMTMTRSSSDQLLTPQGAAEQFWTQFISPLQ